MSYRECQPYQSGQKRHNFSRGYEHIEEGLATGARLKVTFRGRRLAEFCAFVRHIPQEI